MPSLCPHCCVLRLCPRRHLPAPPPRQILDAIPHTGSFLNLWSRVLLFRSETDLVAFTILLATIRVVKVMRSVPNWGPTLIAVILTWTSPVVILYLIVLVGLTAGFAIAFLVAFGAEDPNFSNFGRSFISLIRVGLAAEWFRIDRWVWGGWMRWG
jgi:hypothetical protein